MIELAAQRLFATLLAIFFAIGVAGSPAKPKKKAAAQRPGRRPAKVKVKRRTKTDKRPAKIKPPELSAWERMQLDNYFIKRDYPGQIQP